MDITATAAIAVLVGLAATIITALVKCPDWSTERKRLVSLIVAGVLGVISAIVTGAITPPAHVTWPWWNIMVAWLIWIVCVTAIVFTVAQGIYLQLKTPLDKLTAATSTDDGEPTQRIT